jgi:hypothetical protein
MIVTLATTSQNWTPPIPPLKKIKKIKIKIKMVTQSLFNPKEKVEEFRSKMHQMLLLLLFAKKRFIYLFLFFFASF